MNENVFDSRKNILSRNKQNTEFNNLFYQYIVTAFRVFSIVKRRYPSIFRDGITSLFLTAIWLPNRQPWAIIEGTSSPSLTQR